MKKETISAQLPKQNLSAAVAIDFPENLKELVAIAGEEAVLTNALANWRVTLQANIRGGLVRGETQEAIQARLAGAKMGVAVRGAKVDPIQAFMAQFASSTPEKQKELMAEITKRAAKK